MNAALVVYVALGGALGSAARFLLNHAVYRYVGTGFPYGTFAVNIIGCALFGLILGAAEHRIDLTPAVRAFFLVGVLGGFTTFSAFTFDTLELLRTAAFLRAAVNVLGQIAIGLLALWLGYFLAKQL